MIETQRGLHNAAAIANGKGIDFVLIGTGALAVSLGGFPSVDKGHEDACRSVFDACRTAGVPCGIFTMSAEAAAKRRAEGYAFVTVANDIDVVSRGFAGAMTKFQDSATAASHNAAQRSNGMSGQLLIQFAAPTASCSLLLV